VGLWRDGGLIPLPDGDSRVRTGDELLFAGSLAARRAQVGMLRNMNVSIYVLTGDERPSGWVWRALGPRVAAGS
jgi:voltage-gated potassium channel